tara:strand:- start:30615 stop:30848 length:234 start_codon:yes stop_codon:yes gene_type:complete
VEKQTDTTVHAKNNVVPFKREEQHEEGGKVEYKDVDVLVCSLCGSTNFMLLSESTEIGCSDCGYLIGARWFPKGEIL